MFHERRADLLIEQELPVELPPVVTASRRSGLAARSGRFEHEACLAEATLDDVETLAELVAGDEPALPRPAPARSGHPREVAALPFEAALELVATCASSLAATAPGCAGRVRWVEVEQRVVAARPGRPAAVDRRRGRRVRVEASPPGSSLQAVAELCVERASPEVAAALARGVASRLERLRAATDADGGDQPVVFAPGAGGVMLHELVGHALEADAVLGGRSWLAAGTAEVAAREVRIVDDPRRGRVAWRFDDEGEPARATPLLRDGRVASQLHDLRSAWLARRPPTGHGRRAGYAEPVRPRMGCTFLAAGSCAPEETIASVSRGVYVRRLEAGSVDTRTGTAVFRVTDADRIVEGRIERALLPFLLEVRGVDALGSLGMIADDLELDTCIGSCVKDGQPVATSVGAPTFCIGVATVCR